MPVSGLRGFDLAAMAREFGGRFGFCRTRTASGVSVAAVRHDMREPGLSCVITDDEAEMRAALLEDSRAAASSPPGGGTGPGPGDRSPG